MKSVVVEKRSGTYADTLKAVGVAHLMEEVGYNAVGIRDEEGMFLVTASEDLTVDQWRAPGPGYLYIWERSKEERPRLDVLDYEAAREMRDARRKFEEAVKKKKTRVEQELEAQGLDAPPDPPRELSTAVILASMRKGWNGDRDLAKWIQSDRDRARRWAAKRLGADSDAECDEPGISNSQVLNPISGKGIHSPKTELRSAGSIAGELVDPFDEWMKLRGLWKSMLLYRVGDDFKFYVLEPAEIRVSDLGLVKEKLEQLSLWSVTGVRLDIEVALRCAELLIQYSDVMQAPTGIRILRRTPRRVIVGLRQAYFKSLGTAPALMNDALLPLPDWFAIEEKVDAADYLAIIEEAIGRRGAKDRGCLGSLEERNSDDGRTLQQYRQWILTGDLAELLEFHHQFAPHLMARLGAGKWARAFSTANLTKLLEKTYDKEYSVKEIIESPGFQSVARAIRNTTIYAVRLQNREVQFGLAQKWKQKLKAGNDKLAAAVADFVQTQNWEVVYRLKGKGHVVKATDLDDVIRLIEKHGAELVGGLLLAYGYAQARKVGGEEEESTEAAQAEGGQK